MLYTGKLHFVLLLPLCSEYQYSKYWQSSFNDVFSTSKQRRSTYVDSSLIFNRIPMLKQWGHRHWINLILPTLFHYCFVNIETTSVNISRLNFHFQPNLNVETTLVCRRWIDVILATLVCQRWNNFDKYASVQLSFSTKYQPWNNVEERWQSKWFQH